MYCTRLLAITRSQTVVIFMTPVKLSILNKTKDMPGPELCVSYKLL